MSTVLGDILIKYRADISNLSSGVKSVKSDMSSVGDTAKKSSDAISSSLKKTGDTAEKTGGSFKHLLERGLEFAAIDAGLFTVGGALGELKNQFEDVIAVTEKHGFVEAQTNQVLKSTKDVSGETTQSLNDMADAFSQTTDFSHDTVQSGENLLLTFTNIGKGVFPQATQSILDVSQAMGQDLKSSAIQVGKALGDPLTGMTALQRIGVTFSASEKEQIKTMMAHNNIIGAQKVILHELGTEFGGSAQAAAKTFGGQIGILKNTFEDLKIKIGTAVMPILTQLMKWFTSEGMPALAKIGGLLMSVVGPAFKALGPIIKSVMGYFQSEGFASLVADFQTLATEVGQILGPALRNLIPIVQGLLAGGLGQLGSFFTGVLVPAIDNLVFGLGQFVLWMQGANPWVQVIKNGLLAIGLAIAGMKLAMFLQTLPALIGRLAAWAIGQWAVATATIATALPYILIGALIAAVVFGIIMAIQHWGQIVKWLGDVWATVSGWIGARFSWLGGVAHVVTSAIGSAFSWLGGVAHAVGAAIGAVFDWIGTRIAIWLSAWRLVFQLAGAAFSQFGSFIQGIISGIGGAFSGLGSLISGVWNGIVGDIRQAINWIIGMINGFIGGIDSIGIDLGPIHIHPNIPQIPYLASGGYIQSTGIAVVHAGESVIPAHASAGGYGGQTIILEVDSVQLAKIVNTGTDRTVRLKLGARGRAA